MTDAETKEFLLMSIKGTALWRMQMAVAHPNDTWNRDCAEVLRRVADIMSSLPASDPLFEKLTIANNIDAKHWAEEESQFLSRWGLFHQPASADWGAAFVHDLNVLVDSFLAEKGYHWIASPRGGV